MHLQLNHRLGSILLISEGNVTDSGELDGFDPNAAVGVGDFCASCPLASKHAAFFYQLGLPMIMSFEK